MKKLLKNKRSQIVIVAVVAALIVIAGAFAWSSFAQQKVNVFASLGPTGVHLHDDFDSIQNKDVYVENASNKTVYVRVKLTEYMHNEPKGSLVVGHTDSPDEARHWAAHNGLDTAETCRLVEPNEQNRQWGSDNFHDYFKWKMGGSKYFMPAGYILGEIPEGQEPPVCRDITQYTEEDFNNPASNVSKTLDATVITMAQWIESGYPQGHTWVVDTDGWCYWAAPLMQSETTGLLLDEVEWNVQNFNDDTTYLVNVWLNAVDKDDIYLLENEALTDGITAEGMMLMRIISGDVVIAASGAFYIDNQDGTYTMVSDDTGAPTPDAKPFIPIGADAYGDGATASDAVNADARLYIGDTIDINAMSWNGTSYIGFESFKNGIAPYYNITPSGMTYSAGGYTVLGAETGADGVPYIKVEENTENKFDGSLYIASVREHDGDYTQTPPGTGPFALIYTDGTSISEGEYLRYDPSTLEERFFYHIGNGVYVEVEDENGTESLLPITYYFTGEEVKAEDARMTINTLNALPNPINEVVDANFPLQLTVGEGFDLIIKEGPDGPYIERIKPDGTEYEMEQLGKDESGLYIKLGDDGRITAGSNGILGGGMTGKDGETPNTDSDVFALPKPKLEGGVYQITNRSDMNWLSAQLVKKDTAVAAASFEVVGVNGVLKMGDSPFIPVGNAATTFTGTFDGKNVPIEGLVIDRAADYSGLFGYIGEGGTVANVKLVDANVTGRQRTGGVAGHNDGTVTGCSVTGSGLVRGTNYVGGIVGYNGANVEKCYNTASVTGSNNWVGGIAGSSGGTLEQCYVDLTDGAGKAVRGAQVVGGVGGHCWGIIKDCYMWGDVIGGSSIGGVLGNLLNSGNPQASNLYHAKGIVSGDDRVGGVLGNRNALVMTMNNAVALSTNVIGTATTNRVVGSGYNTSFKNIYAWTGTTVNGATVTAGDGNGADASSQTPAWTWWVSTAQFDPDAWAMPGELPVLRWQAPDWTPESGFSTNTATNVVSIYNATGLKTIRDMFNDVAYTFLMNSYTYKLINDIDLAGEPWTPIGTNTYPCNTTFDGNGKTISNLTLAGNGAGDNYRGLFGFISTGGVVKNVKLSNVNITGYSYVGAVAASNAGTISNCHVLGGTVNSKEDVVGGVVGHNLGTVEKSSNKANVGSDAFFVGGVVGDNKGTVKNCYAWGNVSGAGHVGGVIGEQKAGAVSFVYHANGAVNGGSGAAGGIVGVLSNGNLNNAYALATSITGNPKGTIVSNSALAFYCYYTPTLSGIGDNAFFTLKATPTSFDGWAEIGSDFAAAAGIWEWNAANNLPTLK